jgi:hypothetical protein
MSNQHDNIYNILGKLDALTPKQAPVDTVPAKTINESDWYSINIYQKNTQAEIAYLTTELFEIINIMLKVGDIKITIKNTSDYTNEKTN